MDTDLMMGVRTSNYVFLARGRRRTIKLCASIYTEWNGWLGVVGVGGDEGGSVHM